MTGKTHQIAGIAAGMTWYLTSSVGPGYNPATFGAVLVGSHLSALMPDIDQPAADIWDTIPLGGAIGKVTDPLLKHRNISHSLFGLALFGGALWWLLSKFPSYWGIDTSLVLVGCLVAYASHLLLDSLTAEGIPLLFPLRRMIGIPPKPFEGLRITTGKWFENLVFFPLLNVYFWVLILIRWDIIKTILFK